MNNVVPFPLARRRGFILRHAKHVASLNEAARRRHIALQIKIQRETMLRKGIEESRICRELFCMEVAIREALRFSQASTAV